MKAAVKSSSAILAACGGCLKAACQLCKYNWQAAALIKSARLQVYRRGVFDRQSLCRGESSCCSFWGRDVSRGPHNDPEQGSQHRFLKNEGKEHSWCLLRKLHWDLSAWLVSSARRTRQEFGLTAFVRRLSTGGGVALEAALVWQTYRRNGLM